MSDTPRTDALPKFVTTEGGCYMAEGEHADHVDIADCEEIERTLGVKITQLERALAAANAENAKLLGAIDEQRAVIEGLMAGSMIASDEGVMPVIRRIAMLQ